MGRPGSAALGVGAESVAGTAPAAAVGSSSGEEPVVDGAAACLGVTVSAKRGASGRAGLGRAGRGPGRCAGAGRAASEDGRGSSCFLLRKALPRAAIPAATTAPAAAARPVDCAALLGRSFSPAGRTACGASGTAVGRGRWRPSAAGRASKSDAGALSEPGLAQTLEAGTPEVEAPEADASGASEAGMPEADAARASEAGAGASEAGTPEGASEAGTPKADAGGPSGARSGAASEAGTASGCWARTSHGGGSRSPSSTSSADRAFGRDGGASSASRTRPARSCELDVSDAAVAAAPGMSTAGGAMRS